MIPGLGRATGEGICYPLQYSLASLMAQLVKNLSAMWETWVLSLSWEDPLEMGIATHSSILAWRIPWTTPWGYEELDKRVVCLPYYSSSINLGNIWSVWLELFQWRSKS